MRTKDILTRRPWRIIRPDGYLQHGGAFSPENEPMMPDDKLLSATFTQADMLRQYYMSGHAINDPRVYPDIYRESREPVYDANGNDTGQTVRRVYKECVPRYAFAFQQIIALKQIIHLTGNDIQFELNAANSTESLCKLYDLFRKGWVAKDSEVAFFECVKSEKITADCACVGFIDNGVFGWQSYSYKTGSVLYPHFDRKGNLEVFARKFFDYDDGGDIVTEWCEVWDKTNHTILKRDRGKGRSIKQVILERFGLDGFVQVDKKAHGFPFMPVAYKRNDDGPCWLPSQDSIESYEMSFSQMAQNNQAFGVPTMIFQGEGENYDIQHDLNGTIRTISMGADDKVTTLQAESASESYQNQLKTLYKMIYEQSFAVIPPEVHSGDLPGVAVKMLYSPAVEKAMCDASEWQPFLNQMVRIFSFGYGLETRSTLDFDSLPLRYWIKPYVHVNESAVMNDLAVGVNAGFLSKRTASERTPEYSSVGEWERIMREQKEQQSADLLYTLKTQKAKTPENVNEDETTE